MSAPIGDFVTSTLSGGITATATTMTIGTGLHIPAAGGILQLDYDSTEVVGAASGPETVTYTAYITGTGAITGLVRGQANTDNGTPGQGVTHANGATVGCGPSSLYYQDDGGWKTVYDAWAYASATTITVPTGAAAIYSVGDKIKLTQTTVKYFYVTAVADTVLTVTGGSDYTVANAAITLPYYSKASSPVGFPQWFTYTPIASPQTGSITTQTVTGLFMINGKSMKVLVTDNVTDKGTWSNQLFISLPCAIKTTGITSQGAAGYCNAGTTVNACVDQANSRIGMVVTVANAFYGVTADFILA